MRRRQLAPLLLAVGLLLPAARARGQEQPLPMDPWRIGGGAATTRVFQNSSFRPVEVNLVFDRSG